MACPPCNGWIRDLTGGKRSSRYLQRINRRHHASIFFGIGFRSIAGMLSYTKVPPSFTPMKSTMEKATGFGLSGGRCRAPPGYAEELPRVSFRSARLNRQAQRSVFSLFETSLGNRGVDEICVARQITSPAVGHPIVAGKETCHDRKGGV